MTNKMTDLEKKDIIIGTITNYGLAKVRPYVESLIKAGFTGDKCMVCYNIGFDTVDYLRGHGFTLMLFNKDEASQMYFYKPKSAKFHCNVERFYHMWLLLSSLKNVEKYRYLLSTDVGDVIFQSNPSTHADRFANLYPDKKIFAASECLTYDGEIMWGKQNMIDSFGQHIFEHMKERLIMNCGTLCGSFNIIRDLMLAIFETSQGYGSPNPDQAAYNLLLSLEPYKSLTQCLMSEDGWACQMGAIFSPNKQPLRQNLKEPIPIIEQNEKGKLILKTTTGLIYPIIHQYNHANYAPDQFIDL